MRRRLTLLVAATTSVVLIAFLVPFAAFIGSVAANRAVDRALLAAQSLSGVVATGDEDLVGEELGRAAYRDLTVTVHLPDGRVVGARHADDPAVEAVAESARTDVVDAPRGGKVVLQPVFTDEGRPSVVRVALSQEELSRGVERARAVLLVLGVALFAGSLLVADLLARTLTRPLDALRAAAERLGQGDLDTRVAPSGTDETRAVGDAMNRLAGRIEALLAAEREQVADLSHRLRTPVTVLRLDAEAVSAPDERARLVADVEDLTRHVDEVIREARRVQREAGHAECDAVAVATERVVFWRALTDEQGRALELHVPDGPRRVRLTAEDLGVALDALLGNAVAHTPEGTRVVVTVEDADHGRTAVVVEDSGPGLPFDRMPERGESRGGSTGLGLDIVRRTAQAAGGELEVGRSGRLGGAALRMLLDAPARPRTGEGAAR